MFRLWPGAAAAFARATMEDPRFTLAHLGAAQVAPMHGDGAGMRSALAEAEASDLATTDRYKEDA